MFRFISARTPDYLRRPIETARLIGTQLSYLQKPEGWDTRKTRGLGHDDSIASSLQGRLAMFATIGFEGQKDPDREKND
jgi:hypothetical protein